LPTTFHTPIKQCFKEANVFNNGKPNTSFPVSAGYGLLAKVANDMTGDFCGAYASLLTVYSAHGVEVAGPNSQLQTNLFTLLFGDTCTGKTTQSEHARMAVLLPKENVVDGHLWMNAKEWARYINRDGKPLLRAEQVGEFTLRQMRRSNSRIGAAMRTLWDHDHYAWATARGIHETHVRLSYLGEACTRMMDGSDKLHTYLGGSGEAARARSRFLLVPMEGRIRGPFYSTEHLYEELKISPIPAPRGSVLLSSEAMELCSEWERGKSPSHLAQMAMRIAVISSAANGEDQVSIPAMEAALLVVIKQDEIHHTYLKVPRV
jgi:hypothetical protein